MYLRSPGSHYYSNNSYTHFQNICSDYGYKYWPKRKLYHRSYVSSEKKIYDYQLFTFVNWVVFKNVTSY